MNTKLLLSRWGIPALTLAVLCIAVLPSFVLVTGCKTTAGSTNGVPVYDPVRSAQVVAAFRAPVQDTVNRVIRNSPQHSDEIAGYIRAVGNVFCQMKTSGQFSPEYLITEIEKATAHLQAGVDPLIITVKNTAVMLYTIFYLQSNTAELSPEKWPAHVTGLACNAIDGGLKDAGKPGVDVAH